MHIRDLLKLACLTLTCAAACDDAELDERDEDIAASADPGDDPELRAVAEDPEEDDQDARLTLDPGLDLRVDPEVGQTAAGQCKPGTTMSFSTPNGVCGGCVINGYYPGQKMYNYVRYCEDSGYWSGQYPANPPTSCAYC